MVVERVRGCNDGVMDPFANQKVYNSLLSPKLKEDLIMPGAGLLNIIFDDRTL